MKFQVIYADPPWEYRNKKTGGSMKSGSLSKYETLTVEEICAMNIPAEKDFAFCGLPFHYYQMDLRCWRRGVTNTRP